MPLLFLFILFLTVPLVELYVLIAVGREIGAATTIGLCVATAALGAVLIRIQGIAAVGRVQAAIAADRLPAVELVAGAMLLVAAVMLLTPGFLTDLIGFLVLVPGLRAAVARRLIAGAGPRGGGAQGVHVVIEGEFHETRGETPEERLPGPHD